MHTANPKLGNTLYAHLADIQVARKRAPLTFKGRRALFMRYALDYRHNDIAATEGVDRTVITRRLFVAVGRIVDYLNGDEYDEDE